MTGHVPEAVAAVIAAALRDYPAAPPESQARAAVRQLVAEGWSITAPDTHITTR